VELGERDSSCLGRRRAKSPGAGACAISCKPECNRFFIESGASKLSMGLRNCSSSFMLSFSFCCPSSKCFFFGLQASYYHRLTCQYLLQPGSLARLQGNTPGQLGRIIVV